MATLSSQASPPSALSPLLGLSTEIQLIIIDQLRSVCADDKKYEGLSILRLCLSCRYFYNLITPTHSDLLALELVKCVQTQKLYTCKYCLRLRASTRFACNMKIRNKNHGKKCARYRFCVECGLAKQIYTLDYGLMLRKAK
jgi:hypothetical protein